MAHHLAPDLGRLTVLTGQLATAAAQLRDSQRHICAEAAASGWDSSAERVFQGELAVALEQLARLAGALDDLAATLSTHRQQAVRTLAEAEVAAQLPATLLHLAQHASHRPLDGLR